VLLDVYDPLGFLHRLRVLLLLCDHIRRLLFQVLELRLDLSDFCSERLYSGTARTFKSVQSTKFSAVRLTLVR